MHFPTIFFVAAILSGTAPLITPAFAQPAVSPASEGPPPDSQTVGRAVRATTAPTIDGRDTDAVWTIAPPMTDFRQFDPGENLPPTYRTEARVAYDNRNLYVLVRAYDPFPDSIQSLLSRRDVKTASDQLKIIIDAYHDRRSGVEMAVNPAGVKRDYSIYSDAVEDQTWDGVWDVATHIDSLGWIAEFRVPFSQLRFTHRDVHTFGFGVWRDVQRLNERMAWPTYRQSRRTLISQLGTIEGIEAIGTPRRLELLPYSVVKSVPNAATSVPGSRGEIAGGLDLKAGLGSRVTVDATINPDFGQVEADPAVLNLSAFEIRFDERRPFFQEGAGLYKCGGSCEGVFYTRRIGRTPQLGGRNDPQFTNILAAVKATGRLDNGIAFGLVNASTEQVRNSAGNTVEPRTNYLVARALREMRGGRSQLGLLLTDVRRQQDANTDHILRRSATTLLAQGYHRFAGDRWETNAYTALNTVEGSAQSIALTQRNSVHLYQRPDHEQTYDSTRTSMGGVVAAAGIKQIGGKTRYENTFRFASAGVEANDLGFVTLVNDVSFRQQLDVRTLKPNRVIRSAFSTTSFDTHWTPGGMLAAQTFSLHSSASLHNNWGGAITASLGEIGGTSCVSCARGGPALRQSLRQNLRLDVSGDSRKSWVPSTAYRVGVSDGGRSWYRGANAGIDVRVASRFSTSLNVVYDEVTNDQQWIANYGALLTDTIHYTFARLHQHILSLTARANWTATPTLSFQLYLQPFVTTGEHSNWREIADAGADSYDQRFRTFRDTPPANFNVKQFNSNAVLRWEYRPASALFLVWQQGRQPGSRNPGSFAPYRDLTHIFETRPLNTLLVKFSYWFTP
jgi:hypothetical protein